MPREILAQYSMEDILPLIVSGAPRHVFDTPHGSFPIRMSSARLLVLKENQTCIWCGITGDHFKLIRHIHNCYDVGLYMYSSNKQLMTVDHCIPRARLDVKCGSLDDVMVNLATLCYTCNQKKGHLLPLNFVLKMTGWPVHGVYDHNHVYNRRR